MFVNPTQLLLTSLVPEFSLHIRQVLDKRPQVYEHPGIFDRGTRMI